MKTVIIEEFGCAVQVDNGALLAAAINEEGTIDEWVDVCAPESQSFLDKVNIAFNTNFQIFQFAGR